MTACPLGHDSVATDYCDVCGRRMDAAAGQATAGATAVGQAMTGGTAGPTMTGQTTASPASSQAQRCRRCGTVRSGRFCEGCGLDLDAPMSADPPVPPSVPRTESLTVAGPDPGTGPAARAGESASVGAAGASGAAGADGTDGGGYSAACGAGGTGAAPGHIAASGAVGAGQSAAGRRAASGPPHRAPRP